MSEGPRYPWNLSETAGKPSVELNALAKECGVSEKKIQEVMEQLGCAKPERETVLRPRPGKSPISRSILSCAFADAEKVRKYFGVGEEVAGKKSEDKEIPEGYVTLGRLRIKYGLDKSEIATFLNEIMLSNIRGGDVQTPFGILPQSSPADEIFDIGEVTYISPEVAAKLTEFSQQIFRKCDRWKYSDSTEATKQLGFSQKEQNALEDLIANFTQKYPWITKEIIEKSDVFGGPTSKYYSRDLISFLKKMLESGDDFVTVVEGIPAGYASQSDVANDLELFPSKLEILMRKVLAENTDLERPVVGLFKPGSTSKRIAYFYSPELIGKIEKLKEEEDLLRKENAADNVEEYLTFNTGEGVPSGYLSKMDSISILQVTSERFEKLVQEVLQLHPEFSKPTVSVFKNNHSLRPRLFYSQEVIKAISELQKTRQNWIGVLAGDSGEEQESIPEGYISRAECAIDLAISPRNLRLLVNECIHLKPELQAQELTLSKRGQLRDDTVFYSPELVLAVSERKREIDESRLRRIEEEQRLLEETIALKEKLVSLLSDIARGQEETKLFRKTMSLFGGARTLDILYELYPEFRNLSIDYVKKELATHLSDYMVSRSENVVEDLEMSLPFLKESIFKDTLFTVLKDTCVTNYSKKKREAKERPDKDILEEYVATLKEKAIHFNDSDFNDVVAQVEEYIISLLNDFQKPESIVDELGPDRKFPDLNQIINIKEVADQRRVLIGDEMGMGKSGSAILAKEYLGLRTAIVIVPSNAVDLWKDYLSDGVSPTGKQVGYFKRGSAPRVLEIQNPEDVDSSRSGEYDYVVVSHDRITEECADKLRSIQYDMVIIDEAHKFKNVTEGKRSNALLDMLEDCEERDTYTVMLSGTPIPNKIKDMAIALKLLYPEKFGRIESSLLVSNIIKGDLVGLRELLLKKTQMKKLSESIEMPEKEELTQYVELSEEERELYEVLLRDDQFSAMEKISALRLFCLNPNKVFPDRETRGSKVDQVEEDIADFFETKNKMVLFINGYVNGVIRGENSTLSQINVPEGVTVRIIDGEVSREDRRKIEGELKDAHSGKMLLVVNGGAVDVAVDFSAAEGVKFYNEPWTKFEKMQQTSRVYRPGLAEDITVETSIAKDTIEEGIHYYIELKYRAVVKLLEGIPLSQLEKSLLLLDEKTSDSATIDRDGGLAEEWLQTPMGQMNSFSKITKEIGEAEFRAGFLEEYGEEYAAVYEELETHSFQANTARFVSAIIDEYRKEKGLPDDIIILDMASGPEMLRKRMKTEVSTNVYSLDINEEHFKEYNGRQIVGGFVKLPLFDSSIDYVNFSHSIHYSSFRPERGNYERLHVLSEIARVLKVGGRATINLSHTQRFKSIDTLRELADEMGLSIIETATGTVTSGDNYKSQCVTFEKIEEIDLPSTIEELTHRSRYLLYGLRLDTNVRTKLQGSQKVIGSFTLNERTLETTLNEEDAKLLAEQEAIRVEGRGLIQQYGGEISRIPKEEILKHGYLRYTSGKKNRLVKKGEYSKAFVYVD